jgi:hypothetical protein
VSLDCARMAQGEFNSIWFLKFSLIGKHSPENGLISWELASTVLAKLLPGISSRGQVSVTQSRGSTGIQRRGRSASLYQERSRVTHLGSYLPIYPPLSGSKVKDDQWSRQDLASTSSPKLNSRSPVLQDLVLLAGLTQASPWAVGLCLSCLMFLQIDQQSLRGLCFLPWTTWLSGILKITKPQCYNAASVFSWQIRRSTSSPF